MPVFLPDIKNKFCQTEQDKKSTVIVSPDAGGVEKARAYAKKT